jgi:hypothetical protein
VRNEYSIIKVLVFVSTVTVILSLTYVTHEGRAISSTTNSSSLTEAVQLGASYVQHYKANLVKPDYIVYYDLTTISDNDRQTNFQLLI